MDHFFGAPSSSRRRAARSNKPERRRPCARQAALEEEREGNHPRNASLGEHEDPLAYCDRVEEWCAAWYALYGSRREDHPDDPCEVGGHIVRGLPDCEPWLRLRERCYMPSLRDHYEHVTVVRRNIEAILRMQGIRASRGALFPGEPVSPEYTPSTPPIEPASPEYTPSSPSPSDGPSNLRMLEGEPVMTYLDRVTAFCEAWAAGPPTQEHYARPDVIAHYALAGLPDQAPWDGLRRGYYRADQGRFVIPLQVLRGCLRGMFQSMACDCPSCQGEPVPEVEIRMIGEAAEEPSAQHPYTLQMATGERIITFFDRLVEASRAWETQTGQFGIYSSAESIAHLLLSALPDGQPWQSVRDDYFHRRTGRYVVPIGELLTRLEREESVLIAVIEGRDPTTAGSWDYTHRTYSGRLTEGTGTSGQAPAEQDGPTEEPEEEEDPVEEETESDQE